MCEDNLIFSLLSTEYFIARQLKLSLIYKFSILTKTPGAGQYSVCYCISLFH